MRKAVLCAMIMLMALVLVACACEHKWQEASCLTPQTCTLCGEVQGEPLGHSWDDATCTTAKKCSMCDTVQGEPLGHKWESATCVNPQRCSVCDITQGESLGHNWINATCIAPQLCTVCKETYGDPLGHIVSEFELKENDYINAISVYEKTCATCGEEVEGKEEPIEIYHNEDIFLISPYDFYQRLELKYAEIDDDIDIRKGEMGDKFVCGYFRDGTQKGILQFSNESDNITSSQKYDACFDSIMGIINEDVADVIASLVMTLDPTQTNVDALAIGLSTCAIGEKEVNGIKYQCRPDGDGGGIVWVDIIK